MSHRQAKRLRRTAHFSAADLRDTRYVISRNGTVMVDPKCARSQYQAMKRGRV